MNNLIVEEIVNFFGRTSTNKTRIRKFHAELLLTKIVHEDYILTAVELNRKPDYIKRIVKYSKGFLNFINEEKLEIEITKPFIEQVKAWQMRYNDIEELDSQDENLAEQGIILTEDKITFDGRLTYSKFYKVISDEGEGFNDPNEWFYSEDNLERFDHIDFSNKNTPVFSSRLFLLKFYILRKIDEVAFVTSRFVHCPKCGANYAVASSKIDFQQTYRCEKLIDGKECGTALKKFPARKMIPTYIYEVGVEVKGKTIVEFKEYFLESFIELTPGYYTGMCFGRTETKSNSFYFTCLQAKEEISRYPFELFNEDQHEFFNLTKSIVKHIKKVGFVINEEQAQLPVYVETLKKITNLCNKEINLDHSLYFGAPGIGKTFALTLLHHMFYSNSGFVSGPRFSIAGLTGGQKEIYYQDVSKKKNVPGLFSMQAFVFDEINNAQFLGDDKAVNLFKSVALAASGTSSTVGGKEFPRTSIVAASANYDLNHLQFYENRIKKKYLGSKSSRPKPQSIFLDKDEQIKEDDGMPHDFDYYTPIKNFGIDIPIELKMAVLKVRDDGFNYLTGFPKPLMERFYFSVLVHPKYDKTYLKQKALDVGAHLKTRESEYGTREMMSKLFVPEFDKLIGTKIKETSEKIKGEIEKQWIKEAEVFLKKMAGKYHEFFSMFHRISQVHVFCLFALSMINGETKLSFETKRIFERIISLLHTPININDFHVPNFKKFQYLEEGRKYILETIKEHEGEYIGDYIDLKREIVQANINNLIEQNKIKEIAQATYLVIENAKETNTKAKTEELLGKGI